MKIVKKLMPFILTLLCEFVSTAQSKVSWTLEQRTKYVNYFQEKCHRTLSHLPFKIVLNETEWKTDMQQTYLFFEDYFILDGDTTLLYYYENPIFQYNTDFDSLVQIGGGYTTKFSFEAVGCFDYKDYMIVVYSFPLDDPNYYNCYTVNTYAKDGTRIDRLPFFMWRTDIDLEEFGNELDPSWLEMTGYIDENFEITICQRIKWSTIHNRDNEDFSKEYLKEQENMRAYREYHVYKIDETGHFVELQKDNLYEVDEYNNWSRKY